MKPLSFGMLTTFYPPHHFGGDAVGIQRLARALVRRGHEVAVVHDVDAYELLHPGPGPEPAPLGTRQADGVVVHPLHTRLGAVSELLTQQLGRPVVHRARIERILADGRFDVLVHHNVSLVGGPGILGLGDGVKLYLAHEHWLVCPMHVLWRHDREPCTGRQCLRCSLAFRRPPQLWRWTGLLERELRHVDQFVAMSEFSRRKHAEFGFPREMEVLPYFLQDPEAGDETAVWERRRAPSPHERPYFLFVGRLERIKGLDDVIPLLRELPDADLLISGAGKHEPALREIARGISNVRFLGRVPDDELARLYAHALALIVPSAGFETFGIIAIEAFAHGTPVLVRAIGPLPEIVAASSGGLVFDTPASCLAALRRLAAEPELRERLGRSGYRAFRALWTESAVLPRFLAIVRRAAERKGRRAVAEALAE